MKQSIHEMSRRAHQSGEKSLEMLSLTLVSEKKQLQTCMRNINIDLKEREREVERS